MSKDVSNAGFSTRAIHAFQEPDPVTGAVMPPLYQTTTFAQEDAGVHKGWDYSRCGNPTIDTLAGVLASLEGGKHGYFFASGVGALVTLCNAMLKTGDHILIEENVYGGTFRYTTKVLSTFGVEVSFVDMTDLDTFKNSIQDNTKLIFLESPTNPMLKVLDIKAIADIAKEKNIPTCMDNTFATPYLQQPLSLGVDMILQSTTKYIGGHSDVVGGALILKDDTFNEVIKFHRNTIGANADPFGAWLTLRGVKTLGIRVKQASESAMTLAQWLDNHDCVDSVIYPGLPSHPQHEIAKKQTLSNKGWGGMLSIRVKGGIEEARAFLKACQIFTLAESLGGVESLIEHPAIMTHASVEPEVRNELGITDTLIRLSVGIEDVDDLKADLDQALKKAVSGNAVSV